MRFWNVLTAWKGLRKARFFWVSFGEVGRGDG